MAIKNEIRNKLEVLLKSRKRNYNVLPENTLIEISGISKLISDIAFEYHPVLYIHKELNYMSPIFTAYEALRSNGTLYLNYYVWWEDEIHPNPAFHQFYRSYRTLYYGSPQDIEYVQIAVNIESGNVDAIAFERDPSGKHDKFAPLHDVVIAKRNTDNAEFSITINGKPFSEKILFTDNRYKILVATWNHIYDFYTGTGELIPDPLIKPLSDTMYRKYFFVRRSRPPLK